MRHLRVFTGMIAALALIATPALATPSADSPSAEHGKTKPATVAKQGPKGRAYGHYCKGQSKKHVKGEQGTAFSRCVNAMAKLAHGETTSPTKACKGESKKHVAGEQGTSFSRCVSAGAKLRKDQDEAKAAA